VRKRERESASERERASERKRERESEPASTPLFKSFPKMKDLRRKTQNTEESKSGSFHILVFHFFPEKKKEKRIGK